METVLLALYLQVSIPMLPSPQLSDFCGFRSFLCQRVECGASVTTVWIPHSQLASRLHLWE